MQLGLPGVGTVREYRRYYPAGEVAGHVLGFTNIDDRGQEGLEPPSITGSRARTAASACCRIGSGHVIGDVAAAEPRAPRQDLRTSIDLRIQYLAYRELKRP